MSSSAVGRHPDSAAATDDDVATGPAQDRCGEATFGHVFATYRERLRRHAARVMNSWTDAEDVVQEVFLSFWRRRGEIDVGDRAGGLLFTATRAIALNHAKRHTRESVRQGQYVDANEKGSPAADAPAFDPQELRRAFLEAVRSMPKRQRDVALLCFGEKPLTTQAIADHLGIAPSTVRVLLGRATKTLQQQLPTILDR